MTIEDLGATIYPPCASTTRRTTTPPTAREDQQRRAYCSRAVRLKCVGILFFLLCSAVTEAAQPLTTLVRIYPLGGQAGTACRECWAMCLPIRRLEFDCGDLVWTQTTHSSHGKLAGIKESVLTRLSVRISCEPRRATATDLALVNVGQFPPSRGEPNDKLKSAQESLSFRWNYKDGWMRADMDHFSRCAGAGRRRWLFDLKRSSTGRR